MSQVNVSGLVFDCDVGVGSTVSARVGKLQQQTRVELIEALKAKGMDPNLVDTLSVIQ